MKSIILFFALIFFSFTISSQSIEGRWNGLLKVQGIELRLVFEITKMESGYKATMDSPDQGAKGIPVTSVSFENNMLEIKIDAAQIIYKGSIKDNEIVGTFKQGPMEIPMNLIRNEIQKTVKKKPQEPNPPFDYYNEEVSFSNEDANINLAGTFTAPSSNGTYPTVILISGSGPQNRDEELMGHKPFYVLADFLTKNGYAVLRYDDRGVGKSTGDFGSSTSEDFASDVKAAIKYLINKKEVNSNKIGLVGHSEGGLIAPMVAATSSDVAFIISLAGPGLPGDEILLLQQKLIGKASGIQEEKLMENEKINREVFELIKKSNNKEVLKNKISILLNSIPDKDIPNGISKDEFINQQIKQILNPWMQYFIKYDPRPALSKVKCPVLALNGEKDLQVPAQENINSIKDLLIKAGNKNVTTQILPGLNHLFQECKTGSPDEYATIEQTISPIAMDAMLEWLKKR